MTKLRLAILLAALCLTLAACQAPAEPEPPSVPPPASPSESPPPELSQAPEPEPEPEEPDFVPAPGVACKTVLTWSPRDSWCWASFPPRNGQALVWQTRNAGEDGEEDFLLGIDMDTGEIDFTASIGSEAFLREALDTPGDFLAVGETGYHRYTWTPQGITERSSYTLPAAVREQVKAWAEGEPALRACQEGWDARPEQDLLAWLTEEGAWVSAADGSGAYLAVSMEELYQMPEYSGYLEIKRAFGGDEMQIEDCIRIEAPRLVNGGKTLTFPVYNRISPWQSDDILTVDLETGERRWYWGVFFQMGRARMDYLDDTTLQAGYTVIDFAGGGSRRVCPWDENLLFQMGCVTSDYVHFFDVVSGEKMTAGMLVLEDSPVVFDTDEAMFAFLSERREARQTLGTFREDCSPYGFAAVDGRRFLLNYERKGDSGEERRALLLVTAPEDNNS